MAQAAARTADRSDEGRPNVLLSFVGNHDPFGGGDGQHGPVLSLLGARSFSTVYLFYNGPAYLERARGVEEIASELYPGTKIRFVGLELESPVDYVEIYRAVSGAVRMIVDGAAHHHPDFSILIDPGTPQMQTVWFLLAKSRFIKARLLQGVPPHVSGGAYKVREVDIESAELPAVGQSEGTQGAAASHTEAAPRHADARWIAAGEAPRILGEDAGFKAVVEQARKVAGYEVSVLIRGETGTGKGLIARLVHESSSRGGKPFVTLNCASISASLAQSELFGFAKGAFTGADAERIGLFRAADGGTIFLDEVGDLPLEIQPQLLRVLEEGTVLPLGKDKEHRIDVRVIAATNRKLEERIAAGRFRRDLYERLNQVAILIPPLRDRAEDIPLLASAFLEEWRIRYGESKKLDGEALALLRQYPWPGNVRELRNAVTQMCAMALGELIGADLMPGSIQAHLRKPAETALEIWLPEGGINLRALLYQLERGYYDAALQRSAGNREQAAALLGINGPAFRKALKERFGM